jgi:hypothetical protein
MSYHYKPSELLPGEGEFLRERSFTRWMSRDLLQTASDFLKNIGLLALYAETSPDDKHRYLCWHPPEGWGSEIRSGRTREQFLEFDRTNQARGWPLLSLHINERQIYSAIWISPQHYELAKHVLAHHGIKPAAREESA